MRCFGYGASDVGRRRLSNEDAFVIHDELGLYAVADGMGGHNAGDVASQEALDALTAMVMDGRDLMRHLDGLNPAELEGQVRPEPIAGALRLLESAVQSAAYIVYGIAQHNPDRRGMGTTVSALLVHDQFAMVAQVGDSRIYRLREQEVAQLTEDHTLVAWQLKQGLITEDEAHSSRQRNIITRAVGSHEYVQVDTCWFPVRMGDRYLLCSDGLYGYLAEADITDTLASDPAEAVTSFVDVANERGGRDNITAVIVEVR